MEVRGHLPLTDWRRGNMTGGSLVLPACAGCALPYSPDFATTGRMGASLTFNWNTSGRL